MDFGGFSLVNKQVQLNLSQEGRKRNNSFQSTESHNLNADFSNEILQDLFLVPLSQTITRENANTHANEAPAAITAHNMVPVATLPPPEQLPTPGSGHRAGWVLGGKDNADIAREFSMIKFQHFMFVPNPPFQRSVIFELGPKGDFSPSPPSLPLLWCLSATTPTIQVRGKPSTHHSAGISLPLTYY